jgi:hypothetical protein
MDIRPPLGFSGKLTREPDADPQGQIQLKTPLLR